MIFKEKTFNKALPVWVKGKQTEQNFTVLYETVFDGCHGDVTLRISGYTGYQVFVNGEFVHWGPARAGRGYYRVDELLLDKYIVNGKNTIDVLATGYYCNSFEWLKEPSFFCAELEINGTVTAYTGGLGWKAYEYTEKIRKVQRYSFQRTFAEVYDFRKSVDICSSFDRRELETEICEKKNFIEREISYPCFPVEAAVGIYEHGKADYTEPQKYFSDRAVDGVGEHIDGFKKSECEYISVHMAQRLKLIKTGNEENFPIKLDPLEYIAVNFKNNITGFIDVTLHCDSAADVYFTFDELLIDGKIDFTRNGTSNVVLYRLKSGDYRLISAEPYTLKYLNIISNSGSVEIRRVAIIRADFNTSEIVRKLDEEKADDVIKRIYTASVETFRQNTFDIYMDCPSRERAGWLCDSFFTSRVEKLMTGKSTVEKCFLSNFLMETQHKGLPNGMLSMCYPSDFRLLEYIPNWAMWFLLELKDYLCRTGDRTLIDDAYEHMKRLAEYFRNYENFDGLLEKLDGWVFVEWSRCNSLVQDINYPSNMLYYKFKMTMYELYGEENFKNEAEALREFIRQKSRMGLFFCDNAVYNERGEAELSGEVTETCQYYAFFTGVASIEEDGELWKTMVNDFGPNRKINNKWENVWFSNAFIGNYLRLELLAQAGITDKLEKNIRGYFDYMALRTGTLWEHDKESASCNHGFASYVLVWLDKLGYLL